MARSMLSEKKMPTKYWGEAVRYAVYILNKLPTRSLSDITPYEAWFERKPSIDYLRIFGCVAYMKVLAAHTKKLDERSKRLVHIGREPGTKAYRLFDPISGSVHISRDVTFDERKGWAWEIDTNTASNMTEMFDISEHSPEPEPPSPTTPVNTTISSGGENMDTSATSDHSEQPMKFRSLADIYADSTEVELEEELFLMGIDEPVCFEQAITADVWKVAMETELNSIEKNKTWILTTLPKGHKAIDLKWVFKEKRDQNGEVTKHKARLVAKGYVQRQGVDFDEVFAPVTRLETVRLLLALAAKNHWEVHHLDVKSAFLNGTLLEEVYVRQPKGFVKPGQEDKVYRLLKALYGLRQAPRAWYSRLNQYLLQLGFVKCPFEHAVYTKKYGADSLVVGVYVDDLIVTGTSLPDILKFKGDMSREFDMSDLGKLSYYLGLEVTQNDGFIEVKQSGYAKKVLEKAGLAECNAVKFPMDPNLQVHADKSGKAVNSTQYKSMVGGLRYLVHTRPDIAFAVGIVSRYMERPTELHLNAVKRICRYVKGTIHYGLIYKKGEGNYILTGFSDSDLAGSLDDSKSTGGMAFYLDENLVTWVSQKQRCVALSSCEAEFMAATAAACQAIWLQRVLGCIADIKPGPVILYVDNKSAVDLAQNPVFHGRSKHIDLRYHFIRDCVEKGLIIIRHVGTNEQRADIMTKAMAAAKFERMRDLLGVKRLSDV